MIINDIINHVSKELSESFPKHKIYKEAVKQGSKMPCFFVACNNFSDECYRGSRYRVRVDIGVYYYPENTDNMQTEVNSLIPGIYKALEYVPLDDRVMRGVDRKIENMEDCICFNVAFEHFYIRENHVDNMERLNIKEVNVNG